MTAAQTKDGMACDVDGCAPTAPEAVLSGPALELSVISDAVCPWCYIGKRRLEKALAVLGAAASIRIVWRPFELNPDMPKEGMERRRYRLRKFGSVERSDALDAQVAEAAAGEGLAFRFDRMRVTPNTFDAHRLIWAARGPRQNALMEAIFHAYFCEGADIGNPAVLAELAPAGGIDADRARAFLAGDAGRAEVADDLALASRAGITAVPTFIAGGRLLFSGAQPPDVMAAVLRRIVVPSAMPAYGTSG